MESCVLSVLFSEITGSMSSVVKDLPVDVFGSDSFWLFAAFQSQLLVLSPSAPTFSLGACDSVHSVLESFLGLINRLKPDSICNSHGQTLSRNTSD